MKLVEIADAATRLDLLVADAERGEDVVLTRSGHEVARLCRVAPRPPVPDVDVAAILRDLTRLHDAIAARGVSVSDEEIRAARDDLGG